MKEEGRVKEETGLFHSARKHRRDGTEVGGGCCRGRAEALEGKGGDVTLLFFSSVFYVQGRRRREEERGATLQSSAPSQGPDDATIQGLRLTHGELVVDTRSVLTSRVLTQINHSVSVI